MSEEQPQVEEQVQEEQVQEDQTQEEQVQEESEFFSEDVLELTWDETKEIAQARSLLQETESQLSRLMIQFEKQKKALFERSLNLESFMYKAASELKDLKKIDPNLTYEMKLPQKEGEKGYFIRKDS